MKQCTEYAYELAYEINGHYPCWYDGVGDDGYGKYTNAKLWPYHYRTPYTYIELKDINEFRRGDVLVFTGTYGHVGVVIDVNIETHKILVSDCNRVQPGVIHNEWWNPDNKYMEGKPVNTGKLIGILRCIKDEQVVYVNSKSPFSAGVMLVAEEVIQGKYGNAPYRKDNIYKEIQECVNWLITNKRR